MSVADLNALAIRAKDGDERAYNAVFENCDHFIAFVIKKKLNESVNEDLLQEGKIGVFKALKKFRVDRGVKFTTYASFWITREVAISLEKSRKFENLKSSNTYDEIQADELHSDLTFSAEFKESLSIAVQNLEKDQRAMIEMAFGFNSARKSQSQIEKHLNISNRQHVKTKKIALSNLKTALMR